MSGSFASPESALLNHHEAPKPKLALRWAHIRLLLLLSSTDIDWRRSRTLTKQNKSGRVLPFPLGFLRPWDPPRSGRASATRKYSAVRKPRSGHLADGW